MSNGGSFLGVAHQMLEKGPHRLVFPLLSECDLVHEYLIHFFSLLISFIYFDFVRFEICLPLVFCCYQLDNGGRLCAKWEGKIWMERGVESGSGGRKFSLSPAQTMGASELTSRLCTLYTCLPKQIMALTSRSLPYSFSHFSSSLRMLCLVLLSLKFGQHASLPCCTVYIHKHTKVIILYMGFIFVKPKYPLLHPAIIQMEPQQQQH